MVSSICNSESAETSKMTNKLIISFSNFPHNCNLNPNCIRTGAHTAAAAAAYTFNLDIFETKTIMKYHFVDLSSNHNCNQISLHSNIEIEFDALF